MSQAISMKSRWPAALPPEAREGAALLRGGSSPRISASSVPTFKPCDKAEGGRRRAAMSCGELSDDELAQWWKWRLRRQFRGPGEVVEAFAVSPRTAE